MTITWGENDKYDELSTLSILEARNSINAKLPLCLEETLHSRHIFLNSVIDKMRISRGFGFPPLPFSSSSIFYAKILFLGLTFLFYH